MVSGKCSHPWNKTKKGTFSIGHKQINDGKGCFQKGHKISDNLKELNRKLGKERYENESHPFLLKNLKAIEFANKEQWYDIGKGNWQKLSKKIIERDNFTCQSCGNSLNVRKPNVHHIVPYSISKDNSDDNLVSLCIPCHASIEYYTQLAISEAENGRQSNKFN